MKMYINFKQHKNLLQNNKEMEPQQGELKSTFLMFCSGSHYYRKVQVGKDQEKAQSEKDSHSKNRGGKKPNQQSGTYTMKHIVSRMSSYFPNRWPLSYLNLTKNMKTYIRRQQHKNFFQTPRHKTKRSIDLERSVTQSYWRV